MCIRDRHWGASLTPVAMFKRDAEFAAVCREHPENLIAVSYTHLPHYSYWWMDGVYMDISQSMDKFVQLDTVPQPFS